MQDVDLEELAFAQQAWDEVYRQRGKDGDFPLGIVLSMDRAAIGIYTQEHPVSRIQYALRRRHHVILASELAFTVPDQPVKVAGVVKAIKAIQTKRSGEAMLFVTIEDTTGTLGVTLFPRATLMMASKFLFGSLVLVTGKASHRPETRRKDNKEEEDVMEEDQNETTSVRIEVICESVELIGITGG